MRESSVRRSAEKSKARLGLILFAVYAVVYAGFVLINTFGPRVMEVTVFAGLNLAVVYGMGLIIFAIVLGLIYSQAATRFETNEEADQGGQK